MCIVCIANNINRNVYMYLNTHIFPTTGHARVLLFMFIRRELGGTRTGCLFQFTYCDNGLFQFYNKYCEGSEVVQVFRGNRILTLWGPIIFTLRKMEKYDQEIMPQSQMAYQSMAPGGNDIKTQRYRGSYMSAHVL